MPHTDCDWVVVRIPIIARRQFFCFSGITHVESTQEEKQARRVVRTPWGRSSGCRSFRGQ